LSRPKPPLAPNFCRFREESLTAAFREEMAKNPKNLEEWVSMAGKLGKKSTQLSREPTKKMPRPRKASTARKKGEAVERPETTVPRVKVAAVSAIPASTWQ